MPIKIYDGTSDLTMTNGTTYSPVELAAVPRFYMLTKEKCLIWQDGEGVTFMWRRWNDMLSYLTEEEREQYDAEELDDDAALDLIITRMSLQPITADEVADALIETDEQTQANTEDIALCMDAIIELGDGLKDEVV